MLSKLEPLFSLIDRALKAHRGRPVALAMLLGLCLANLLSEWPFAQPLPEPLQLVEKVVGAPFRNGRQLLFDGYQKRWPREPQSQPVTIVAIDETSLAKLGQWPWPRNRLAALVDAIAAQGALAIGLDIYMPEPDQTSPGQVAKNLPSGTDANLVRALAALPSHEAVLARSLHAAPTILGAAAFDHAAQTTSGQLRTVPLLEHGGPALPWVRRFDQVLASLPELQAAAPGQALLSVALEQGVVRRLPLVMGLGDHLVPGLAVEMLRLATDSSAVEVFSDGHGLHEVGVADVRIPTQPSGDVWLHFAKQEATRARYVRAVDVLEGKVNPEQLQNKLVMIGLTGAGLNDMRTTALGELVPGIEIQAQLVESIIDGRFLQRPTWLKWAETGLALTLGLFIIWYVPRADSRLATFLRTVPKASVPLGLVLNASIAVLGFWLFREHGLLADAAAIFILLSGVMGSMVASAMSQINKAKQDAAKAEQQRALEEAFQAGEQAALARLPQPLQAPQVPQVP